MLSTAIRYPVPGDHAVAAGDLSISCAEHAGARTVVPAEAELRRADVLAVSLAAALDRIALPLSRAAVALRDREAWFEFGYARLADYVRERHGRDRRWITDLVALGRGVAAVPELGLALAGEDGGRPLGFCSAVVISRVITPQSAEWWIGRARELTVARLRRLARTSGVDGPVGAAGPMGPTEGSGSFPVPAIPLSVPEEVVSAPGGVASAPGTVASGPGGVVSTPDRVVSAPDAPAPGALIDAGSGDEGRYLVRYIVPVGVKAAFEEALDLYRAVVGHEGTVTSFVEALVAEAMSGAPPPDLDSEADAMALGTVRRREAVEQALAHATNGWAHLPERPAPAIAAIPAGAALGRLAALERVAGSGGAAELDAQMRELTALEDDIRFSLGELLAGMGELRGWRRLGFDTLGHYAEQRLGICRTRAEDLARASRQLADLPVVREAWQLGRLGLEATLHIARMLEGGADPAIQSEWVDRAAHCTVKRMRDEVRAIVRASAAEIQEGEGPPARSTAGPAEGPAAEPAVGPAPGPPRPLDDAAWLASIRREPGLTRRRVRMMSDLTARRCRQTGRSGPDIYLCLRLPALLADDLMGAVESERGRLSRLTQQVDWWLPWPDPDAPGSVLAAREYACRSRRVPAWVGLLSLLEGFVKVWDDPAGAPRTSGRGVLERDGYRCTAPGCTSRCRLEVHHVVYQSRLGDGGDHNLTTACRFHHQRGEHGGLARVRGRAPLDLVWRLGRSETAEWFRNERRIDP